MNPKIDYYIEIPFTEVKSYKNWRGKTRYNVINKQLCFYFDMYCWCNFAESEEIALTDFDKYENDEFMSLVMYYAAISAHIDIGIKINFSKDDVKEWIAKMPQSDFQKIFECMLRSRIGGESLVDLVDKSVKKKSK